MDIVCPRCAEPCDADELHYSSFHLGIAEKDYARKHEAYRLAQRAFFDPSRGCGVVFDCKPCRACIPQTVSQIKSLSMADILGDDVDGIASLLEEE